MATQLNARALTTNEQAANGGYTHEVVIDVVKDLTLTTADGDMTFNIFVTQAGDTIVKEALRLQPAFKDASDAAFNSTAISMGDEDSATRFISGVQANENGTEVIHTYGNTAYTYTGVKQITVLVESMTAKALSDLDVGQAVILFELLRHSHLGEAAQNL